MTEVTRHVLSSANRAALYEALLAARRPLTVTEGARLLGLAESTTRFHFDHLVSAGLASRSARPYRRGRPQNVYAATAPTLDREPGDEYQTLARVLADQLDRTPDAASAALEAGRRWSAEIRSVPVESGDPVSDVLGLMTRLGFDPLRAPDGAIHLRRCPFEAVAREHRNVVCGVHRGLLDEALRHRHDGWHVAAFKPFVRDEPLLCIVEIAEAGEARSPEQPGGHIDG